jgi:hypothetical protein
MTPLGALEASGLGQAMRHSLWLFSVIACGRLLAYF